MPVGFRTFEDDIDDIIHELHDESNWVYDIVPSEEWCFLVLAAHHRGSFERLREREVYTAILYKSIPSIIT